MHAGRPYPVVIFSLYFILILIFCFLFFGLFKSYETFRDPERERGEIRESETEERLILNTKFSF